MSVVDEIIVLRFMQNSELVQDQTRPPTEGISSGSHRLAIVVAITALTLFVGYFAYIFGQITAQNTSHNNRASSLQPTQIPNNRILTFPTPTSFVPKTVYAVPTTDPVMTANWKTYTSEKYGFSFRHPSRLYANTPPPCPPRYTCTGGPDYISFETAQRPPGATYDDIRPTLQYEAGAGGFLHLNIYDFQLPSSPSATKSIVIGGKTGKIYVKDYYFPASNREEFV